MSRLNASHVAATCGCTVAPGHGRACLECGAPVPPSERVADFCSARCRQAFNNRRASRGALLYDLMMVGRFERGLAAETKVWRLIARFATSFRDEDRRDRDGRHSWRSPAEILARHPALLADVLYKPARRS